MFVDLHSDTGTRPTAAMRAAMAAAEVGDEQLGEDPTTRALEERVAGLLGKDRAVFLATGSLANKVALATLTSPGDSVVCDHRAHVFQSEAGGAAIVAGVQMQPVHAERGWFDADALRSVLSPPGNHYKSHTSVVSIEQTHNFAGGTVWPLDAWDGVTGAAHEAGVTVHVDGARLLNAVAASGVPAGRWAAGVDTVWIDLSKGLGCPGGAVLAGDAAVIADAVRWKYRLGGALRQSGILAAAGMYALDHHVDRLADDHATARRLADGLTAAGMAVEAPETNMVFFDPAPTGLSVAEVVSGLRRRDVRVTPVAGRIRAVTHLDVGPDGIEQAVAATADVVGASAAVGVEVDAG